MGKKLDQADRISHDFASANDAELNAQIAAFQARYREEQGQLLAMDARRSLGPGRDRITFRVRGPMSDKRR